MPSFCRSHKDSCVQHHLTRFAFSLAVMALITLTTSCADILLLSLADDSETKGEAEKEKESDWKIGYYIDDYGDQTSESYLINKARFRGRFSNFVVSGKDLTAEVMVSAANKVRINLYEYGLMESVSWDAETYMVKIKTLDNREFQGEAICRKVCLLSEELSQAVHQQLMTGESLKFYLEHNDEYTGSRTYRFSTGKHQGYGYTFDKL